MENEIKSILDAVKEMKSATENEVADIKDSIHNLEQRSGVVGSVKPKKVDFDIKGFAQSETKNYTDFMEAKSVSTLPASAGVTVPEIISNQIIESAIENQIILNDISFGTANSSDFKIPYIETRPEFIQNRGENTDGSLMPLNEGQSYGEYASKQKKFTSSVFFSDEIMQYGIDSVTARFMKLIGEDMSGNLIEQFLNGDGSTLQFRGLLNSRIDKSNVFVEALKDDSTRGREFYMALASGTAGELGADNAAKINNLIDLQTSLPSKYQPNAKFYMDRTVFADIRKMVGTDGHPVFGNLIDNGADGEWKLLGKSIVLVDHMAEIGSSDALVMYGDLGSASQIVKQFEKMINDPYTRPDGSTITFGSVDSEIMGAFDSVRMLVAIA
ncbi:putative Phage major capsid protein [Vibrio crassostreae]|nr:putative Phage major capsid protein [Vibrio crassostreae]